MAIAAHDLRTFIADRLLARNEISRAFFACEAERLASASENMAERFLQGGRLLAFGRHASATDAAHVAVEFVHPVIVGKRALPALDLSSSFTSSVPALVADTDIVVGFAAPDTDAAVEHTLASASRRGALTLALPGAAGDIALPPPSPDTFVCQELVEVLYHTLWETVHVFFEHQGQSAVSPQVAPRGVDTVDVTPAVHRVRPTADRSPDDIGASGFLYPFLTHTPVNLATVRNDVAASIQAKAKEDERLREVAVQQQSEAIAAAAAAVAGRVRAGGRILCFGNGGSATDANDWVIDCMSAGSGRVIPAVSLSTEAATLTALANDIGTDAVFLRQLIAHAKPHDVAIAVSTSGGSANVMTALKEARKRGLLTVALLGYDGGEILRRQLADLPIVVACDYIPRIQEVQASIYHVMTEAWRQWLT